MFECLCDSGAGSMLLRPLRRPGESCSAPRSDNTACLFQLSRRPAKSSAIGFPAIASCQALQGPESSLSALNLNIWTASSCPRKANIARGCFPATIAVHTYSLRQCTVPIFPPQALQTLLNPLICDVHSGVTVSLGHGCQQHP